MNHQHGAGPWPLLETGVVLALLVAASGYAAALRAARDRSPWPVHRTALWFAGLVCAGAAMLGPVAEAARASFTAHMLGHVLLGMLAPLLLVLGAPVTLALRALPADRARTLTGLLRHPVVRIVTRPAVAATLNAGGLWLLYTTDLYHQMHGSALVHAGVHAHVFLAGYVFTASILSVDPDPHRAPLTVRAAVLVTFIAVHSVLAKWLYAHPPEGVELADAEAGAQLMYYAGDVVDVTLIVLLLAGWYTAARPRDAALVGPRAAA
ncbi:putative membrane protein [Georgenia soli]|uniref:Putative membrane protein n=1 Tax=Georgenia soli TaxID=638953 RepID=A0A2A9F1M6_9MICO|nr:cytochrome c oxidase assembly protein [Georgenia soli]PFG45068.1 putative membrane protein [Georgenia soli]